MSKENMNEEKELMDQFAMSALATLIAKMPFYDVKGEIGVKISQEELSEIKKGIAETAYEYASHMIISRKKSHKWLEENN